MMRKKAGRWTRGEMADGGFWIRLSDIDEDDVFFSHEFRFPRYREEARHVFSLPQAVPSQSLTWSRAFILASTGGLAWGL
jgi:hypothetical protein